MKPAVHRNIVFYSKMRAVQSQAKLQCLDQASNMGACTSTLQRIWRGEFRSAHSSMRERWFCRRTQLRGPPFHSGPCMLTGSPSSKTHVADRTDVCEVVVQSVPSSLLELKWPMRKCPGLHGLIRTAHGSH